MARIVDYLPNHRLLSFCHILQDLQRRLEEKESTVAKYEQLLTESHKKHSEEIRDLTLNKEKDFATIIEKNSTELCSLKRSYEKELDELQAKLISSKDKEIGNVKEEHQNILLEKEQEIVRLRDSCCGFENEIGRLNGLLIEQKSNQETASDCVQSLEEKVREAHLQLKQTEEKLRKSQNEVQKLQVCMAFSPINGSWIFSLSSSFFSLYLFLNASSLLVR